MACVNMILIKTEFFTEFTKMVNKLTYKDSNEFVYKLRKM